MQDSPHWTCHLHFTFATIKYIYRAHFGSHTRLIWLSIYANHLLPCFCLLCTILAPLRDHQQQKHPHSSFHFSRCVRRLINLHLKMNSYIQRGIMNVRHLVMDQYRIFTILHVITSIQNIVLVSGPSARLISSSRQLCLLLFPSPCSQLTTTLSRWIRK